MKPRAYVAMDQSGTGARGSWCWISGPMVPLLLQLFLLLPLLLPHSEAAPSFGGWGMEEEVVEERGGSMEVGEHPVLSTEHLSPAPVRLRREEEGRWEERAQPTVHSALEELILQKPPTYSQE